MTLLSTSTFQTERSMSEMQFLQPTSDLKLGVSVDDLEGGLLAGDTIIIMVSDTEYLAYG